MEMLVIAGLALVAFAAVLLPLFRRGTRTAADEREFDMGQSREPLVADEAVPPVGGGHAASVAPGAHDEESHVETDDVEREVLRYRAALRAGTLCPKCGQANPAESVYCSDCGKRLPLADAREFD